MLNENANALSELGQRVSDVGTLWSYEVQQAMATFGPAQTIASAVDAFVDTPGLSLKMNRSFGSSLADRNSSGLFGRGWKTVWDTFLTVSADKKVSLSNNSGLLRQFTPVENSTTFVGQPGDTGSLAFF